MQKLNENELIMGQKPKWFATKKAVITGTKIWQ